LAKTVTMGEIMLRFSPPGHQRFAQTRELEISYGGAEANVAMALAGFGHNVVFVTRLPFNALGDCARGCLMEHGIDCSHIARGGDRLGTYYLENGTSVRPVSVIYDRAESAFDEINPSDFDFDKIFEDAQLFHVSGITPVLSDSCAETTLAALKKAKEKGITTSFDLNYRAKLWKTDIAERQKRFRSMMPYVDICFGNARDAALTLGYGDGSIDYINGDFAPCVSEPVMRDVLNTFGFKYMVTSLRNSTSASHNIYSAFAVDRESSCRGTERDVIITDRVGSGDAFAAGFLNKIIQGENMYEALEFGIASAAMKHTIPGDVLYASEEEIQALIDNGGSARVVR
jgi:2-dehydro-3-deoxygluconokinase